MEIADLIQCMFEIRGGRRHRCITSENAVDTTDSLTFMDSFFKHSNGEVPVFAINADHFKDRINSLGNNGKITCILNKSNKVPYYRSFNRGIEDLLQESYSPGQLIRTDFTKFHEEYWGMHGALFDKNLQPLMLCCWNVHRTDSNLGVSCSNPTLRIAKECFTECNDTLKRFILNKIIPATLNSRVRYYNDSYTIKVLIDDFPCKFRKVNTPSISTSNEDLIDLILNHLINVNTRL